MSRELPMPTVTRITNLPQAHATLLHCWTRLSRHTLRSPTSTPAPHTSTSTTPPHQTSAPPTPRSPSPPSATEKAQIQAWLHQWEAAFTSFLSAAMAAMGPDDITHSRVLKANHLACSVLAADDGAGRGASADFEAEFGAVVELAGAVVRARGSGGGGGKGGLDVREPLRLVLARGRGQGVRRRAGELLGVGGAA